MTGRAWETTLCGSKTNYSGPGFSFVMRSQRAKSRLRQSGTENPADTVNFKRNLTTRQRLAYLPFPHWEAVMFKRISGIACAAALAALPAMASQMQVTNGWFRVLPNHLPAAGYFSLRN